MIPNEKLDKWILGNKNVLLVGEKGVGKSSIILEAMTRNNLHMKYFSAATMDPWVDFIGVPKITTKSGTVDETLELIRDKSLEEYEILFFDEFNRAHKKVRNAVMELIQFKSINGKKLPKLRMVWAAVNPDDSDYDVEPLDPAQKDRFHIHYTVDYKIYTPYFSQKFGPTITSVAKEWWEALSAEVKKHISPRRLDYTLEWFNEGGDIRDVIPTNVAPVNNLINNLKRCSLKDQLHEARESMSDDEFKQFINDDRNFSKFETVITEEKDPKIVDMLNMEHMKAYESKNTTKKKKETEYVWNPQDPNMRSHIAANMDSLVKFVKEDLFETQSLDEFVPNAMENKDKITNDMVKHKKIFGDFLKYVDKKFSKMTAAELVEAKKLEDTTIHSINTMVVLMNFVKEDISTIKKMIPNIIDRITEAKKITSFALIPESMTGEFAESV